MAAILDGFCLYSFYVEKEWRCWVSLEKVGKKSTKIKKLAFYVTWFGFQIFFLFEFNEI